MFFYLSSFITKMQETKNADFIPFVAWAKGSKRYDICPIVVSCTGRGSSHDQQQDKQLYPNAL